MKRHMHRNLLKKSGRSLFFASIFQWSKWLCKRIQIFIEEDFVEIFFTEIMRRIKIEVGISQKI